MDGDLYRVLLEEFIWPEVKFVATRQLLWFMQDGATCHTTLSNLEFLHTKFIGRVISDKSEVTWPPKSPDLNPLDFFF